MQTTFLYGVTIHLCIIVGMATEAGNGRATALAAGELHAEINIYQTPTSYNQTGERRHHITLYVHV